MKHNIEYLKNSNTGEILKKSYVTDTWIKRIPVTYYDVNGKCVGEDLELTGFVPISEKKFNREKRRIR